ncbi:MAG: Fic family protein, partial [Gammaproteobacteria bacterium]|nr:Fic family protein [Gammaproteobacteria bacterium]
MKRQQTGYFETKSIGGEQVRAFVPDPLPPKDELDFKYLQHSLDSANFAIGRLDSITSILPEPWLILYTYIRKEAVLSSQIEGTQSTLSDLMLFELTQAPG